jgi:hypothetical protein
MKLLVLIFQRPPQHSLGTASACVDSENILIYAWRVEVRNMGSLHNTSSQSAGEEIVNIVTKPR